MSGPFRFGVQVPVGTTGPAWTDLARRVEDLGYATLLLPDHFGDQLAPVPAPAADAAVTTVLPVGPLVLDNDHRHPVVLARRRSWAASPAHRGEMPLSGAQRG